MLPMLEREDLLAQLRLAADIAMSGRGRIVVLGGEAGSGKTRLVTEFLSTLDSDIEVATGYCERNGAARPLGPLHDIVAQPAAAFQAARAAIRDGEVPPAALIEALRAGAKRTVLVFEDAHWADAETLDLLRFMCRRIDRLPALVIVTYRNDVAGPDHPFTLAMGDCPSRNASHLALEPLSRDAVEILAALRGEAGSEIFRLSAGNAFLTAEMLRQSPQNGTVPGLAPSIRQSVAARLSALDECSRKWVELLSLCPDSIDHVGLRLIGEAFALDPAVLPGWNGLLVERGDECIAFRQEAARLAVLETLMAERRHRLGAEAFVALSADPGYAADNPALLASLAESADMPEAVITHARLGARQAIRARRYGTAAALLKRALPFAARSDPQLHARLAEEWAGLALATRGLDDDALAMLRQVGRMWQQQGRDRELVRNRVLLGRARRELGLFEVTSTDRDTARDGALHEDSAVRAHALVLEAQQQLALGNLENGRELASRAMREARLAGDGIARLNAWLAAAQALHRLGRARGGWLALACARIAGRDGLAMAAAAITACLCDEALAERDLAAARSRLGPAPQRNVPPCWVGGMAGRYALVQVLGGELREGEALAARVLADPAVRPGMRYHAALAMAFAQMRRMGPEAESWLDEAGRLAQASASCRDITQIHTAAIEQAFLAGRLDDATRHCARAEEIASGPVGAALREELACWQARIDDRNEQAPRPRLASDPPGRAEALKDKGLPFEAAMARLLSGGAEPGGTFGQAIAEFESIGAEAGVALARRLASDHAIRVQEPGRKRGPYRAARAHPLGLTRREVEILRLMVNGDGNREIAAKLGRSLRTVEHHVSAILGKMGLDNRIQAAIHAISRPEILRPGHEDD